MTQEEKARRYDEALIRGSRLWESDMITRENYEYIFPELKESEGERIRKMLIEQMKRWHECAIENNVVQDIKDSADAIAWLEKQGKNNMGISEATKQKLEDNLHKALEKETPESWNEFLDEQGEQNTDEYIEVKGLSEIEAEADELIKEMSGEKHNLTDFERTLADICIGWIGEEPGWVEYIKDNADVLLKIAVKMFNSVQDVPFEQKPAPKHKVGDTIYYNSFGKLKSMIVANVVTDSTDNPMYEDKEGNAVFEKDLVEQKPAWSEEDEAKLKSILFHIEDVENKDVIDWLKSLKDRVQLQNIAYYNPYKEVVESIAKMCKHYDNMDVGSLQDFYDNVKVKCKDAKEYDSLFPQSRWKPSDEQMKILNEVLNFAANHESPHWNDYIFGTLNNLIRQLKKLREE